MVVMTHMVILANILVLVVITIGTGGKRMLKKISAQKARQNFGELMDEVRLRGDRYIVNRGEKPLVAVIPVEEYVAWEQARERLYKRILELREKNRQQESNELEAQIKQAIEAVQ